MIKSCPSETTPSRSMVMTKISDTTLKDPTLVTMLTDRALAGMTLESTTTLTKSKKLSGLMQVGSSKESAVRAGPSEPPSLFWSTSYVKTRQFSAGSPLTMQSSTCSSLTVVMTMSFVEPPEPRVRPPVLCKGSHSSVLGPVTVSMISRLKRGWLKRAGLASMSFPNTIPDPRKISAAGDATK